MIKNTIIDGIAASEHLDSSGESLSIEGMDISSLGGPDSILNWEHNSKEKPTQVIGKVTFAKKIMKESDAKTKREKHFWNKTKKPMVYIKAELFDGVGHSGAQDVAAMLRYNNKDKGEDSRLVVGFSIEGGKMEKKGMVVTKSIARDVAITVKPCNKVCDAELIEDDVDEDFLYKNQEFDCEIMAKGEYLEKTKTYRSMILQDLKKRLPSMDDFQALSEKMKDTKSFKQKGAVADKIADAASKPMSLQPEAKPKRSKFDQKIPKGTKQPSLNNSNFKMNTNIKYDRNDALKNEKNNMRKALIAGMMGGSPDSKTGTAALTSEDLNGTLQKPFHSKAQRRFAHANPEKFGGKKGIKEWEEKTPKGIPEKIKKNEGNIGDMEDDSVYLQHYSPHAGLKSIDPNQMGTGVDKRTKGRSLENKISFYYPHNYKSPENVVTGQSKSKYTVKVPKDQKIYSSQEHGPDMIRMAKEKNNGIFSMDHFIDTLKENGYHGFKSSPSGIDMVAMFHELPVHSEESSVKKSEKLEKNETNHFFHQPHILFSVEQPYHPTKYKMNHEAFINKLKQKGFDVDHVNGKYGGKENSIVVKNPTPEQFNYINKISQKLGQDSVIHSDGKKHKMLFLNGEKAGKYHIGQGTNVHEKEPEDFYSTTSSGTHFTHNFDFDNLHSDKPLKKHEKLEKMSQPVFSNKNIGSEIDLRSDVKMVDPEKTYKMKSGKEISQPELETKKVQNKYVQGEKAVSGAKQLSDFTKKGRAELEEYKQSFGSHINPNEQKGVNVQDPNYNVNEAYEFKQKKPEGSKPDTSYPSTRHHEATHKFFSGVAQKMGKDVSTGLMDHILEDFFDPKDLKTVNQNLSNYYDKDDPHLKEESLTHILDLIQNKEKRQQFHDRHSHMNSGELHPRDATKLDRERMNRLKRGYQNAVKFVNSLNSKQLKSLVKQRRTKR